MKTNALNLLLVAAVGVGGCGVRTPAGVSGEALQFANFRGAAEAPTYRAVLVDQPPVVDGRMDPAYRAAEEIELVFLNGDSRPPTNRTFARVICTRQGLHVFFRCRFVDPKGAAWTRKTRDSDVWFDNNVEIFLEPAATGSRRYYQFTVNPGGALFDAFARDGSWNGNVRVSTAAGRGEWTAEFAIPFAELGLEPAGMNKLWRMNLTRLNTGDREDTSWCVLRNYNSHVPSRFGYLWVDAGTKVNVPAQRMQPWVSLFDGKTLRGWRVLPGVPGSRGAGAGGTVRVRDGAVSVGYKGRGKILLDEPIPYDAFVLSAEVYHSKQLRFMFSPDPGNEKVGYYATFINYINESNVALLRNWEFWLKPLGGHLTQPATGPCSMQDWRWYRCDVYFRPDRITQTLNGQVINEAANLYPQARYFGLDLIGEGKIRNIRMRRLVGEE